MLKSRHYILYRTFDHQRSHEHDQARLSAKNSSVIEIHHSLNEDSHSCMMKGSVVFRAFAYEVVCSDKLIFFHCLQAFPLARLYRYSHCSLLSSPRLGPATKHEKILLLVQSESYASSKAVVDWSRVTLTENPSFPFSEPLTHLPSIFWVPVY